MTEKDAVREYRASPELRRKLYIQLLIWRDPRVVNQEMFDLGADYARSFDHYDARRVLDYVATHEPPKARHFEAVVPELAPPFDGYGSWDESIDPKLYDRLSEVDSDWDPGELTYDTCRSASQLRGFLATLAELAIGRMEDR